MGCTASKSLEMQARMDGWSPPISRSFVRSLSMPLRTKTQQSSSNSHVVALTSTTYGALTIPEDEALHLEQVSCLDQQQGSSQELVKPEVKKLASVPEAEVIDLSELMKDLNEDDDPISQRVFHRKRKSSIRSLSRSISSVDSMRELDVKIRTVALALPNLEKKLLALDALNSISSSEQKLDSFRKLQLLNRHQSKQLRDDLRSPPRKRKLLATKSMKGLFYGETLQPSPRNDASSTTTMASSLDCSSNSSSSSSYDASSSSGDSEELSGSLFDPEVLKQFRRDSLERNSINLPEEKKQMSLEDEFPEICPPKGEDRAVLYVTSLRGIRKTFEDCNRVRMILQGFGITIDERDVSMHAEFRQELNQLLQSSKPGTSSVPRLFIRGRYLGGVDEVGQLNEEGVIGRLVEGISKSSTQMCEGCGGVRFVPCFECSGSCKVVVFGGKVGDFSGSGVVVRCPDCNENGLIRCPVCL